MSIFYKKIVIKINFKNYLLKYLKQKLLFILNFKILFLLSYFSLQLIQRPIVTTDFDDEYMEQKIK